MDHNAPQAADPFSSVGQQFDTILVVKRRCDEAQVGDFVKIFEQGALDCTAKLLRTGRQIALPWLSFFPLKYGERCDCATGKCRCVSTDRQRDIARIEAIEEKEERAAKRSKVSDPNAPDGQVKGALLAIKHRRDADDNCIQVEFEIGDVVELIGPTRPALDKPGVGDLMRVKNLRIDAVGNLAWQSVFPVGTREMCACYDKDTENCKCDCIYEDFEKSLSYAKALSGHDVACSEPDWCTSQADMKKTLMYDSRP